MLGSYRLLLLVKLILFELLGLKCIEDNSFRRYRRLRSSINSHTYNSSTSSVFFIISASVNDKYVIINCSTPEQVSHERLDWYFKTQSSSKPPRVIWQSGLSNNHRYTAYSPDRLRHYLQIRPIFHNDSGTYECVDQTSGFSDTVDLIVYNSHNNAENLIGLHITTLLCLLLFLLVLPRYITSEIQVQ